MTRIRRPKELSRLKQEMAQVTAEIAQLQAKAEDLRMRLGEQTPMRSRRELLKLAGAAVLGATGGAALSSLPAEAATGGSMTLGMANDANAPTTLTATGVSTPQPLLYVFSQGASSSPPSLGSVQARNEAPGADGVTGWAFGSQGFGVHGMSDVGFGVTGESAAGVDVLANGTGRVMQSPLVAPGPPGFSPGSFEQARDANGVLWLSGVTTQWRPVYSTVPVTPVRVINTDPGIGAVVGGITGPLMQGNTYTWTLAGSNGIPADAIGIIGNITAVAYTSGGFLTMFPAGVTRPVVSSVNFSGTFFAWGNHFTVGFGSGANAGQVSIYIGLNTAPDTCHVIVDVFAVIQ
jgi:hypothetical protein